MTNSVLQEKAAPAANGMAVLALGIVLILASAGAFVAGLFGMVGGKGSTALSITLMVAGVVYWSFPGWLPFMGLKTLRPQEALVLTLFGKYYGTLRKPGFYFVNPFVQAVGPVLSALTSGKVGAPSQRGVISLKALTLNNDQQKINDKAGNPIIIGIVAIWRVVDTVKAVFNVDNYEEFLSIQCDSALRGIVSRYPYDAPDGGSGGDEKSLRGNSKEIADALRAEIQEKVETAGLEIIEARITHLSYAPEIAAAMLQRQQASAVIDARQMIVDGAVGMVEMALSKLSDRRIVELDEERKAAMVSSLLVVLCSNRDPQPVLTTGRA